MTEDYQRWQARRQGVDKEPQRVAGTPSTVPSREGAGPAARSGDVQVQEHHASTTIIERIYRVLGKRG